MKPLMAEFFRRHAKGDKWVPFHTVLGTHELYIQRRIGGLPYLSEGEKYALACGFSGSRWPELYDECVMDPCFPPGAGPASPEGRALLADPAEAFQRGGVVHRRFDTYRARGGRLHTLAYSPRPIPTGASGDEYTFYILERTRTFLEMGKALHPQLDSLVKSGGWQAVDAAMQQTKWLGPTLGKMFLVSTHLAIPRLGLLEHGTEVGIGAQEAFKLVYPGIQAPKDFSMLPDRRELLLGLRRQVCGPDGASGLDALEPRLRPMVAWCAERAKARYGPLGVPAECFSDHLGVLDFQVALCEWRKFRNNVDHRRTSGRGVLLGAADPGPLPSKKKRKTK